MHDRRRAARDVRPRARERPPGPRGAAGVASARRVAAVAGDARRDHRRVLRLTDRYGTGTPWIVTGPTVGSSSVAWLVPAGVMTSIAFGAVPGSMLQIGETPPGAQSPNWNGWAVGAKPRAWSGLKPSCPCSTTENVHPLAGWPSAAAGTAIVIALEVSLALTPRSP